jgi:hypothetical protein
LLSKKVLAEQTQIVVTQFNKQMTTDTLQLDILQLLVQVDVFAIKTDATGNPIWKKAIGESASDYANDIQQTSDSGFIVCGYSNSTFSGGFAGENIYLIKLSSNGNILWSKIIGGAGNERANSVRQTSDGGFIIAGTTNSWGSGGKDFYLIKTDANGNISWTKTFGGALDDVANSVKQTSDGGFIVAGETNSFGAGDIDYYLIKTDALGTLTWSKTYGEINSDWLYSVVQASNGGYVMGGYSISFLGAGEADAVVIKTDSTGSIVWSKTYGEQFGDVASSMVTTNDNGYALAGGQSSFPFSMVDKGLLFKIDSVGNFIWANTFINSNDVQRNICKTSDGGYAMTGDRLPFSGIDLPIIKTNANGTSGCNELSTTLTSTNIFPQVSNPATLNSSGGTALTVTSLSNNGGVVTNLCFSSSINEITQNNLFTLSPNPSSGNFIIAFQEMIVNGNVKISNIIGEEVFTESIFGNSKKEINLKNIQSGIYFVKLFDGEKYYCKKVIIERD